MTAKDTVIAARIARECGQSLRRFVASRLRHVRDQVDDVCQEVYLRLLRTQHLERIENPEAYLIQVANHTLHDVEYGKRPRESLLSTENTDDSVPDPADAADLEKRLVLLDRSLEALPPRVRASFLLYRVEGLTHGEVAAQLGVHPNTVKNDIKATVSHISQSFGRNRE